MTTKPPSSTEKFPADSLESIAYAAAHAVPGREPNDMNRLGYSVWAWLKEKKGTLEDAVKNSGVRTDLTAKEAAAKIGEELKKRGVAV